MTVASIRVPFENAGQLRQKKLEWVLTRDRTCNLLSLEVTDWTSEPWLVDLSDFKTTSLEGLLMWPYLRVHAKLREDFLNGCKLAEKLCLIPYCWSGNFGHKFFSFQFFPTRELFIFFWRHFAVFSFSLFFFFSDLTAAADWDWNQWGPAWPDVLSEKLSSFCSQVKIQSTS